MKFDTLIIGGGIAGLSAALYCQRAGLNTALISAGQSALHFSSGSIDLLSRLPDGTEVIDPLADIAQLAYQNPQHPYSKLGSPLVQQALAWYQQQLVHAGIQLKNRSDRLNHQRLTPLGTFRPTWMSQGCVDLFPPNIDEHRLKRIALVTLQGFRDFQPILAADNLRQLSAFRNGQISCHTLSLDAFRHHTGNLCESRSVDMARLLQNEDALMELAHALNTQVPDADCIFLPALFTSTQQFKRLESQCTTPLCELSTMPPSLLGLRLEQAMGRLYHQLGGTLLRGDAVLRGEFNGQTLGAVYTRNYGDIPLQAQQYMLATGSFFSHGLKSRIDAIYEPIFNLDVVFPPQRKNWYQTEFFSTKPHPFLGAGVNTNARFQALRDGQPLSNLYAAGALLAHYNPVFEGCGSGVAIASAYQVARQMVAQVKPKETAL